MGSVETKSVLH